MISAYLAEDEPLARAALATMLQATADFTIVGQCDNGAQALQECVQRRPDVLFADIQMPILDGLELAAALADDCPRTQVVFITAHDQHAIQAFRLAAVDYLLKPVSQADFQDCLNRVRRGCNVLQQRREHFIVRSVGHIDVVPVGEVVAIRATGNYLELITAKGCYLHRQTLKTVLDQLDPAQFVQVHRSIVVALRYIRRLEQRDGATQVCMEGDLRLPVSAAFRAQLKSSLGV